MATLLYRLGKTAFRRWPLFLAGWLVAAGRRRHRRRDLSKPMSDAFSIPGIPSEKAADLQAELFPGSEDAFDQATVTVVVAAPEGHTLDEPTYAKAVDALVDDLPPPADGRRRPAGQPGRRGRAQQRTDLDAPVQNGTPQGQAEANAARAARRCRRTAGSA